MKKLKPPQAEFRRQAPTFEKKIQTVVGVIEYLRSVAPALLKKKKMENPDFVILNAGFGKIETPFSPVLRFEGS